MESAHSIQGVSGILQPSKSQSSQDAVELLTLIDKIKKIMLLNQNVLEHALKQFEKRRYNDRQIVLETFDMTLQEAEITYFPSCFNSCRFMFEKIAFYSSVHNQAKIKLLDSLTVIAIFMDAFIDVKLNYLFNWYNYSKNALMTEYEFTAFLVRTSQCISSLRLINAFELPFEDAAHFALLARSYVEKNEIKLKTFIGLPDFIAFFATHPVGKGFFSFFNVIQRLIITLDSLNRRSISLDKIVQNRYNGLQDMIYVPKMDLFDLKPTTATLAITSSAKYSLALAFEINPTEFDYLDGMLEVFVLLEKIVELPNVLYTLPHTLDDIKVTNQSRRRLPELSRKISLIPSYRKSKIFVKSLDRQIGSKLMKKIRIDALDPGSVYQVTLYTKSYRYMTIVGTTMPSEMDISGNLNEPKQLTVTILPGSMGPSDVAAFTKTNSLVESSNILLFTGQLISFENELHRFVHILQHSSFSYSTTSGNSFANSALMSIIKSLYSDKWMKLAMELFHSRSFTNMEYSEKNSAGVNTSIWRPESREKQLLFVPSWGPISPPQSSLLDASSTIPTGSSKAAAGLNFLSDILSIEDSFAIQQTIQSLFDEYSSSLVPERNFLHIDKATFIFIGNLSYQMSMENLVNFLNIYSLDSHGELADSIIASKKIVLIMHNPYLLFGLEEEPYEEPDPPVEVPKGPRLEIWQTGAVNRVEMPTNIFPLKPSSPKEKLRGRHELLHGEFRNQSLFSSNNSNLRTDAAPYLPFGPIILPDFQAPDKSKAVDGNRKTTDPQSFVSQIITKLIDLSMSGKTVDIICTNWSSGCNIEISSRRTTSSGNEIFGNTGKISIESLLQTPSQHANEAKERNVGDRFIMLLKSELSQDISIKRGLEATENRAITVYSGDDSHKYSSIQRSTATSASIPIPSPLPTHKLSIDHKAIETAKALVKLVKSPKVVHISDKDVIIEVFAKDFGRIFCTLFETPTSLIESDALALLVTERDSFRKIAMKSFLCKNRCGVQFQFFELQAATSYCIIIDPFDANKGELPHFCLFKTLADSSCNFSSSIVASVNIESKKSTIFTHLKIKEFRNMQRSTPTNVFLLGHQMSEAVQNASFLRNISLQNSLRSLQKVGNCVLATESFCENHDNDIIVNTQGKFCQIIMRKESNRAFKQLLISIKAVILDERIINIILFLRKPLIRYLRLDKFKKSYIFDGLLKSNRKMVQAIVYELLSWKASNQNVRDCIIIALDVVKEPKCVVFQSRTSAGRSYESEKLGIKISDRPMPMSAENSLRAHSESRESSKAPLDVSAAVEYIISQVELRCQDTLIFGKFTELPSYNYPQLKKSENMFQKADDSSTINENSDFDKNNSTIFDESSIFTKLSIQEENLLKRQTSTNIRHIILPARYSDIGHLPKSYVPKESTAALSLGGTLSVLDNNNYSTNNSNKNNGNNIIDTEIIFPVGACAFGALMQYEVLHEINPGFENLLVVPPQSTYYGNSVAIHPDEPLLYGIDITTVPVQYNEPGIRLDRHSMSSHVEAVNSLIKFNFHLLVAKCFVHDIDYFDIVYGPIVGAVDNNSANIVIEVNRPMDVLQCVIKSFSGTEQDVVYTKRKIKAFCVTLFEFKNLTPGCIYEVSFPTLKGPKSLCKFKTIPINSPYVDVLLTGKDSLLESPLLNDIVEQIINHQLPIFRHMSVAGRFCYGATDLLPTDPGFAQMTLESNRSQLAYLGDSWIRLANELKSTSSTPLLSFHIDSQSFLTVFLKKLIDSVLSQTQRLELPLRDASATGAYFFYQFEELLKDSFRLVMSLPMIKDAFASGSSQLLYRSSYFLPLGIDQVDQSKIGGKDEKELLKLLQVIRKIFELTFLDYFGSLYNFKPEALHNTKFWKCDKTMVALIDNVSGRSKIKGKKASTSSGETLKDDTGEKEDKDEGGEKEEKEEKDDEKETKDGKERKQFSIGFFDKTQWKIIKNLCEDASNFHIVLLTEYPILSWEAISMSPLSAEKINLLKGQSIPWRPDYNDLQMFFDHWMDWMMPKGPLERIYKDITFVSMNDFPFSTIIQDVSTGVKIHQICLGRFNLSSQATKKDLMSRFSLSDVMMSGKIGKYRFNHSLGSSDLIFDSSRDITHMFNEAIDQDKALGLGSLEPFLSESGFGKFRIWMDSWKSKTIYQTIRTKQPLIANLSEVPKKTLANLVLGPIIGPISIDEHDVCKFSILIEVDMNCECGIEVMNSFTNEIRLFSVELDKNSPKIICLGPLDVDSRYRVTLVSGVVMSPFCKFIISTNVNWSESNIVALNCDSKFSPDWSMSSEFSRDLINRCHVPFNGITMVAHMNLTPDLKDVIMSLEKLGTAIESKLQICLRAKTPTTYLQGFLQGVYDTLREYFRSLLMRPSYRELLKSSFHMFIPTKPAVDYLSVKDMRFTFRHLLFLMIARLNQEYFDQVNYPDEVVYKAYIDELSIVNVEDQLEDFGEIGEEEIYRSDGKHRVRVCKMNPSKDAILSLFRQWSLGLMPIQSQFRPWVSPNKRATFEMVPYASNFYKSLIADQIKITTNLELGVRILTICDNQEGAILEEMIDEGSDLLFQMQHACKTWLDTKDDRRICFISPSSQHGTRRYAMNHLKAKGPQDPQIIIGALDTFNRSNGYQKTLTDMTNTQIELTVKKGKKGEGGGKSKKAQLKREQELRMAKEKQRQDFIDSFKKQRPDGYIIIECRTSLIQSRQGVADVLSMQSVKIVFSELSSEDKELLGEMVSNFDPIPTYFDYLQIPDWLLKFMPNKGGLFVQDDVLFLMRNRFDTREALDIIEGDEMFIKLCEIYERSRLSELSRPPELREVNLEIPELLPIFVRDLLSKIWDEIPENIKFHLVNFQDDFLRSLILSRSLPDIESLSSADTFAAGCRRALMYAVAIKLSYKMKSEESFQYILNFKDEAGLAANQEIKRNKWKAQILKDAIKTETIYDDATLNFMVEQKEAEEGAESDIEDLLKENANYEQYLADIEREEEEREAKEREEEERKEEKRRLEAERRAEMEAKGEDFMADDALMAVVEANEKAGVEATNTVLNDTVDWILQLSLPIIAKERRDAEVASEAAAATAAMLEAEKSSTADRLSESYGHMNCLVKCRLEVRNRFGPTLTHLSPS